MKNLAIADAFKKTEAGRAIAHAARSTVIGDRIRALKGVAHEVFVEEFHRWDIFQAAREPIRQLGVRGGQEYNKAVELLQFALIDRDAYKQSIELLAPAIAARHEEVAARVRTLKQMVYDTYVVNAPAEAGGKRYDVYYNSKDRVRKLGMNGGAEYEQVLTAVKFASQDRKSWNEGIAALLPPKTDTEKDAELLAVVAGDFESSDGQTR
jgi:hypothetical protein